jgi:hypothetical protein
VIDVIAKAGSPDAYPAWQAFTDPTEASGAWVKPSPVSAKPPKPTKPKPKPHVCPVLVLPDRGEVMQEIDHLHGVYKTGLKRPQGLCRDNGSPDAEGIGAWIFDVYQNARINGKSPEEARAAYMEQIRNSAEWKANNP